MSYEKFVKDCLAKGLLKKQKPDFKTVEKLILRARKDIKTARANLTIDEGIAYTVAYLAMLRAGRAIMLLKGFRPADGFQHKTVVEYMSSFLGEEYRTIIEHFDKMRRKRNIFTYDVSVAISKREAENALETAVEFVSLLEELIKKNNPQMKFRF